MSDKKDPTDIQAIPVRVLVVDDDENHAEAVADSLTPLGYECVVAGSGEKGLTQIESQEFDVVITDLKMGEIDGLELLQKAKEELPDAEVILLTGHSSFKSALAAGQAGAFMYLTKPVDLAEFEGLVEVDTRLGGGIHVGTVGRTELKASVEDRSREPHSSQSRPKEVRVFFP